VGSARAWINYEELLGIFSSCKKQKRDTIKGKKSEIEAGYFMSG